MKALSLSALSAYDGSYAVKVFDGNTSSELGGGTLVLSGSTLQFTPAAGLSGSTAASATVSAVCENTDASGKAIGVVAVIDANRHIDFFSPAFSGLYTSGSDLGSSGNRYMQGTTAKTSGGAASPGAGGSSSECAPLVAKAGDSVTYRQSSNQAGSTAYTVKYDFSAGSYKGQAATVGTVSVVGVTAAQAGVGNFYLDPVTGAALGQDAAAAGANDTVTSYDPPDWQQRLTNAGIPGGGSGKINVTATMTGKSVSDAFAPLGGATAIVMKYEFAVNRDANETVSTAAGSFANACKFRVEFALKDFQVQGPASASPLLATMLPILQSSFAVPTKTTLWTSNAVPFMLPKSVTTMTLAAPVGTVISTQELIAVTKAPR
jgi:hypothetical protein